MKVHPINCKCRTCKKKQKQDSKDLAFVRRSMLLVFLFLAICF